MRKRARCRRVLARLALGGWVLTPLLAFCALHGSASASPRPAQALRLDPRVAASHYEVELVVDSAKLERSCHGGDVAVLGEHNQVRLRGAVGQLVVTGDANEITIEGSVRLVTVVGNFNKVTYRVTHDTPPPRLDLCGERNQVTPK
jgi:Protein of unknown function (DUF3060)